jgi:hypothetical protein
LPETGGFKVAAIPTRPYEGDENNFANKFVQLMRLLVDPWKVGFSIVEYAINIFVGDLIIPANDSLVS